MRRAHRGRWFSTLIFTLLVAAGPAEAQWVRFVDETATRLVAAPALGASDVEEKDYAWGDLDQDGDIDLVVVRKQPWTSPGKRPNVLLMNEGGVLVDRTAQYASAADVAGDQGFLTPTNDRDVVVVDVNADGWLDVVTAVTLSDGDPKHIGHPRVYRNLGNGVGGAWQGLRFEDFRIPAMLSTSGQAGFNPRFCSVAAGDLTGDGRPELWFGDYDSSGAGGFGEPAGADFDDKLLINLGSGSFTDGTSQRFSGLLQIPGSGSYPFAVSAFGAAGAIADMNGDGRQDIVKQTSLNDPLYVGIAYNDAAPLGYFDTYDVAYQNSPYFISVGDLNNDARQDIVVTDDGADRYLLNQGNGADGLANFLSRTFSYDQASDDSFGSQSVIADLNNDGFKDVLIADVDVDISGCSRRLHVYRNLGGLPGSSVTLQEQTTGTGCETSAGNPPTCLVAGIPADLLEGVHNVAVFDLNGDGWRDMVVGRCAGTQIYMSVPVDGLAFSYPQGLPAFVAPGTAQVFEVKISGNSGLEPDPGSARMFVAVAGGPLTEVQLTHVGDGHYEAVLSPTTGCADAITYYFGARTTTGLEYTDPSDAPAERYHALAAVGTEISYEEGFEAESGGWSVSSDPSLTGGAWQVVEPVGSITGGGQQAAPDADAEPATSATHAFVTQNGVDGGPAGAADVDGGPTDLVSPSLDLAGGDAVINYSRWFFSDGADTLVVAVSNNGGAGWVPVEIVTGMQNLWQVSSFTVSDFVTPTADVRVRFRTSDNPNNSVTEAAVDQFRVERITCLAAGLNFSYPLGLPATVPPGQPQVLRFQVAGFGGLTPEPSSGRLHVSTNGGPFVEIAASDLGGGLFEATLPAAGCGQSPTFYFSARTAQTLATFADPSNAPVETFRTIVTTGLATMVDERFEGDVATWTVVDTALLDGGWEAAAPSAAYTGTGAQSAPDADAEPVGGARAFVTRNGVPGGFGADADVDGGPTDLISPAIDLTGTDGFVSYSCWFFSDGDDVLEVSVSGDGGTNWSAVESVSGEANVWTQHTFRVGDFVTPGASVRVRFRTSDNPDDDITEAGLDVFRVERLDCQSGGAGRVPDGAAQPGVPLTLAKAGGDEITLAWGASCAAADTDYEVYEGTIGIYPSHAGRLCSTGGSTGVTLLPAVSDAYYLIVPTNGAEEGSYGTDGNGTPRPQGSEACRPQLVGACP